MDQKRTKERAAFYPGLTGCNPPTSRLLIKTIRIGGG